MTNTTTTITTTKAKKKKSNAQIRRLEKRAAKRGETYTQPIVQEEETNCGNNDTKNSIDDVQNDVHSDDNRLEIAISLKNELKKIEMNETLKAKDRRSAKRKAEAIASEQSGMAAPELLEWYEKQEHSSSQQDMDDGVQKEKIAAANRLQKALKEIEMDETLKAKDRRSAKRKAEAIAVEESKCASVQELLDWYQEWCRSNKKTKSKKQQPQHDPYIAFVGQLSFNTTKEQLLEHIRSNLGKELPQVTSENIQIRMLTDSKTKKSRGMAFVQVQEPDTLYALLKLHQTFLDGRRINVERSAGGNKNSKTRKEKLSKYRQDQENYFAQVVESILGEYKETGELREDELDDGVVALCKRHSGPVVRAAVAKYIEGSGRDMDNPSAYLTYLITKFSREGVYDDDNKNQHSQKPKRKQQEDTSFSSKRFRD